MAWQSLQICIHFTFVYSITRGKSYHFSAKIVSKVISSARQNNRGENESHWKLPLLIFIESVTITVYMHHYK